jgi:hypothetical protein
MYQRYEKGQQEVWHRWKALTRSDMPPIQNQLINQWGETPAALCMCSLQCESHRREWNPTQLLCSVQLIQNQVSHPAIENAELSLGNLVDCFIEWRFKALFKSQSGDRGPVSGIPNLRKRALKHHQKPSKLPKLELHHHCICVWDIDTLLAII